MVFRNPAVAADIKRGQLLSLHLGSGGHSLDGFYNVDIISSDDVDIVADLNQPLKLLPDNSVGRVVSNHVFEHVRELLPLLAELHRVCAPGAEIRTTAPHFSNPYAYSDPTHVRFFGLYSMCYFVEEKDQPFSRKVPAFYTPMRYNLVEVFYRFYPLKQRHLDKVLRRNFEKHVVNRSTAWQERYERTLYRLWPAKDVTFVMTVRK